MSEQNPNDNQLLEEREDDSDLVKSLRSQLKETKGQLSELEGTLGQERKQRLLHEVGVDVNQGAGKFFAEKYDGELTTEAIQEAASEYGIPLTGQNLESQEGQQEGQQAQGQQAQQVDPAVAAQRQISQAHVGAVPHDQKLTPQEAGRQAYEQQAGRSMSKLDAQRAYFRGAVVAANEEAQQGGR